MKLLIDAKNVIRAWEVVGGGWGATPYTEIEVDNIPIEVKAAESGEYCYTAENGYYKNPDYVTPEDESVDYDEIALDHEFRISMLELGI